MYPLAAALLPHPPILISEIGGEEALEAKLTLEGIEEVARRFSSLEPDTLVLISPHGNLFQDAICILDAPRLRGDLSKFGARDLQFEYETDQEMIKNLRKDTRDFPLLFLDKKGARKLGT
ncbi:MAG TPA: AmmeMemoRadiSam system protein A, partial [Clostridia bacterium]|nr:AmmeMemoRadiSam system protein A [Clostridia bacterium]